MSSLDLKTQAGELENLLPAIARRLFAIDPNHPANNLPIGQVRLCSVLMNGPRTMSHVGDELKISQSAVTQLVDRLVKTGLVERVTEPDDRRIRLVRLTTEGEVLMRTRKELRLRRTEKALSCLSDEARQDVLGALNALLKAAVNVPPDTTERLG